MPILGTDAQHWSLRCFCGGLRAPLAQRYNFKFYGEEEGLQNLGVQVVLQDRAGSCGWARRTACSATTAIDSPDSRKAMGCPDRASSPCTNRPTERCGSARARSARALERRRFEPFHGAVGSYRTPGDRHGSARALVSRHRPRPGDRRARRGQVAIQTDGSSPDEGVTTVYIDGAETVWYSCGTEFVHAAKTGTKSTPVKIRACPVNDGKPSWATWTAICACAVSIACTAAAPAQAASCLVQDCRNRRTLFPRWRWIQPDVCWCLPTSGWRAKPNLDGRW